MANNLHLEKLKNGHISATGLIDVHETLLDNAYWPSEGYGQLKFPTFKHKKLITKLTISLTLNCKGLVIYHT